ncbi:MAG: efflux RND transporter permease subunit, partial [Runella slithyformis]
GLVLGIGMVVDSAIIVIENIEQFRAEGKPLDEACIAGTNEVMMPLFTSILTNSAVFLPLVFISGIAGALFFDQAVAVSLALGISLLTSFTLIPVLYRLFYLSSSPMGGNPLGYVSKPNSLLMRQAEKVYHLIMYVVFEYKIAAITFFFSLIILSILLFFSIPKQGMPTISRTELEVKIDWNEAITVEENELRIAKLMAGASGQPVLLKEKILYISAFVGQQQFLLNRDLQQNFNEALLSLKVTDKQAFDDLKANFGNYFQENHLQATVSFSAAKNVFEQLFSTNQKMLEVHLINNQQAEVPPPAQIEKVYTEMLKQNLQTNPPALQNRLYVHILKEKLLLYDVDYERVFTTLKTIFNENNLGNLKAEQRYIPIILGGDEKQVGTLLRQTTVLNTKGQ